MVEVVLGFYNALMLVFLTLLFATTWGGTLFLTLALVVAFIAVIAFSRGLSVWFCWWLESSLCLTRIQCKDKQEFEDIWRFLAGGLGVSGGFLVENKTRGFSTLDGVSRSALTRCKSERHHADRIAGFALTLTVGVVCGALGALAVGGIWILFVSRFYGLIIGSVAFLVFGGLYGSKVTRAVPVLAGECPYCQGMESVVGMS